MKPIIFNAIDKIYNEKTGMIVPVSAAVGSGPEPTPTPTTVTSTVTYTETEATVWKMELAVTEGMSFAELTEQYPDWTGSVTSGEKVVTFTADDITVDYITVTNLTTDSVPSDGDECTMVIMNDGVELYNSTTAAHVVEIPVPVEKFTLNSVMIDGPYSGGPFSNVYDCHYDITFNETPPANCEDGYGGYHGYAVISGVCVADTTGVIKDTGDYQINGLATEHTHPDDYQYQNGDPVYPYGQTFGPATITITDNDGNVWATATTDNVTFSEL